MRHARQDASFRDRGIAPVSQNTADRNALMAKGAQQQAAGFVMAHNPYRQNVYAEIGKIIDRVGAASRHDGSFAMFQNQHWSFSRHARDLSEDKLVCDQVSDHGDGDLWERFDDLSQPLGLSGMFGHLEIKYHPNLRNPIFSRLASSFRNHPQHGIDSVSRVH